MYVCCGNANKSRGNESGRCLPYLRSQSFLSYPPSFPPSALPSLAYFRLAHLMTRSSDPPLPRTRIGRGGREGGRDSDHLLTYDAAMQVNDSGLYAICVGHILHAGNMRKAAGPLQTFPIFNYTSDSIQDSSSTYEEIKMKSDPTLMSYERRSLRHLITA